MHIRRLSIFVTVLVILVASLVYFLWPTFPPPTELASLIEVPRKFEKTVRSPATPLSILLPKSSNSQSLQFAIAASREFQTTRDLHGLFIQFRDSSNPDEKYFALRAMDFCARYLKPSNRNIYSTDVEQLPSSTAEQDVVNHNLYARCAAFKDFSPTQYRAELKRLKNAVAIEDSNITLAERASNLVLEGKEEAASQLVRQVLLSKEPDAIASLENYIQDAQKKAVTEPGTESAINSSALAIRLAACVLGKDCSKDSLDMQSLCVYGSACTDSLEEKTAKLLSPSEMQEVLDKRDIYVAAIKNGDLRAFGL